MTTAATLSLLPSSLYRSRTRLYTKRSVPGRFGFRVVAVLTDDNGGGSLERKNSWESMFEVEDPRPHQPPYKGKFIDAYQALEVARFDIQYCDWRARNDLLAIMLLHEKVVEVLNPLAREYKSIGTIKKELAGLQEELTQAHQQVHISEARVEAALEKLAFVENFVNDKLLLEKDTIEVNDEFSLVNQKHYLLPCQKIK